MDIQEVWASGFIFFPYYITVVSVRHEVMSQVAEKLRESLRSMNNCYTNWLKQTLPCSPAPWITARRQCPPTLTPDGPGALHPSTPDGPSDFSPPPQMVPAPCTPNPRWPQYIDSSLLGPKALVFYLTVTSDLFESVPARKVITTLPRKCPPELAIYHTCSRHKAKSRQQGASRPLTPQRPSSGQTPSQLVSGNRKWGQPQ